MRRRIALRAVIAVASVMLTAVLISCIPKTDPMVPSAAGYAVMCPTKNEQARQLYNDGNQYADSGKTTEAEAAYRKAIQLDPEYCDAMDNLGRLLRRQGRESEAAEMYQRSLSVLPTNPTAHQNLAFLYWRQGSYTEALDWYQKLIAIAPNNPEGYFGVGSLYLDKKEPEKAVSQLLKAEELYAQHSDPLVRDARYQLGVAYYNLNDARNAIAYLEKAGVAVSQDKIGISYLGASYYILGNIEQAKKYLGKAKSLGVPIDPAVAKELGL